MSINPLLKLAQESYHNSIDDLNNMELTQLRIGLAIVEELNRLNESLNKIVQVLNKK